ncbi:MAG: DUF373 family protein [Candidatus Methanomethylophilaceae archaeon]|nr:DUF373 family protein [Candidatus Methanomethylophilaceae archaeon]
MAKTLVLVVDRDDDFGVKGSVNTPVIGLQDALVAAVDLGVNDPEDSDVNGLFAGIKIYNEMKAEGKDVEIALICGDKTVGHRSDEALTKELDEVIEKVSPEYAVLVSDGAEDEYVYPIITTHLKISSVKKVYVKQTPGIEGFVYIVSKTLSDPAKKKRFLAPIGALITLIALIYIIADVSAFSVTESSSYLFNMTAPLVVLIIGILILNYAYDGTDAVLNRIDSWKQQVRENSVSAAFTLLAVAIFALGVVLSFYSVKDYLGNGFLYLALLFISNMIWPVAFSVLFSQAGRAVNQLVEYKAFDYGVLTSVIMGFGIAFVMQAVTDFLRSYMGFFLIDSSLVMIEVIVGVVLMIMSSSIAIMFKRLFQPKAAEAVPDEV